MKPEIELLREGIDSVVLAATRACIGKASLMHIYANIPITSNITLAQITASLRRMQRAGVMKYSGGQWITK